MILVDTSVWIDHFRRPEPLLLDLLKSGSILTHPLVIEELACGHLRERKQIIELLHDLPSSPTATHDEVRSLISANKLYATGLGAIDVHLIASAMLSDAALWTKDKALAREAGRLRLNIS